VSPPLQYGADYGSRGPDHHPIFRGYSEEHVTIVSTMDGLKEGLWLRRLSALYVAVDRLNGAKIA
jgi:hypothetical protein